MREIVTKLASDAVTAYLTACRRNADVVVYFIARQATQDFTKENR